MYHAFHVLNLHLLSSCRLGLYLKNVRFLVGDVRSRSWDDKCELCVY